MGSRHHAPELRRRLTDPLPPARAAAIASPTPLTGRPHVWGRIFTRPCGGYGPRLFEHEGKTLGLIPEGSRALPCEHRSPQSEAMLSEGPAERVTVRRLVECPAGLELFGPYLLR